MFSLGGHDILEREWSCRAIPATGIEHAQFRDATVDDLMALIRKEAGINVLLSSPRENYDDIRVSLELKKAPLSEVIRYFLMPFPGARARADGNALA